MCCDCSDEAMTYFAGALYCGRCALERLIRALRAEVEAAEHDTMDPREGVLVDT